VADATDGELDPLFAASPGEFVAERNKLARRLRAEGRADEAAAVAAFRKPPLPVWVVNQLARRHRRDVDLLLDAGHRLRAAQGERDPQKAREAFEQAREQESAIVRRLVEAAGQILTEERRGAAPAMLERIAGTLRAATISEEGRELLARGRLTQELATSGFEVAAALSPAGGPAKSRAPARPPADRDDVETARKERDEARARAREATRRLRDAERAAARARRELEGAEDELERARAEAERAEEAANAAAAAVERTRRRR
jgi:hypothetical protein